MTQIRETKRTESGTLILVLQLKEHYVRHQKERYCTNYDQCCEMRIRIRIQLITLMPIRILTYNMMRIHADSNPQHCCDSEKLANRVVGIVQTIILVGTASSQNKK